MFDAVSALIGEFRRSQVAVHQDDYRACDSVLSNEITRTVWWYGDRVLTWGKLVAIVIRSYLVSARSQVGDVIIAITGVANPHPIEINIRIIHTITVGCLVCHTSGDRIRVRRRS